MGRKEEIIKHSFNIIDLIEEGDWVDKNRVIQVSKELKCVFVEKTYYNEITGEEMHIFIKADEIKTIVTKEQFELAGFEVKEEK